MPEIHVQTGSGTYLIFVAAVFFLYWGASWSRVLRLAVMVFANLLFCAQYSVAYVVIVPACALFDFLVGLALSHTTHPKARRLWLGCSVGLNLAILLGLRKLPALASGPAAGLSFWPLALPLGMSFYALQSLTYTIDLYRKDGECVPGFARYLSAAAFFPMLEAGPISRLTDLAGQFSKQPGLSREDGGRAFFWICSGLIKKALVADYLSRNLVNRVFDTPNLYSGFEVLIGVYAYSLQIYYDFSGYTDIARGAALLLGIRLPANFNSPYLAANLTEFWRRWHMSFSNWLRDYLYFSLPGGRTKFMPYLNMVITMVLAGLWHGLSATFALWGLLHGLGLAATRGWWALVGGPRRDVARWRRFLPALLTYHFVCLTWILFRAGSVENALAVAQRIASWTVGWENLPLPLCAVLVASAMALLISERWRTELSDQFAQSPPYVHVTLLLAVAIGIQMLRGNADTPFVYSRF
jgi:D-alanyl-lipoteichoic acid acyltransferase DltB (MBOAT superfamily)